MTYSVVITNYNGAGILKKNIPLVIEAVGKDIEVIVVDDCSTDNSLEVLKDLKVKYFQTKENSGFSTSTNLGVKQTKTDLVILLNSDVVPHKGFLKTVISKFKDENLFAVGLHDIDDQGKSRGRGVAKFTRGLLMHRPGVTKTDISLWASGGSGAFRKSIWDKIGGLDEIYNPAYGEDVDLGYRAWKMGYKIIFDDKAVVDHRHEQGALRGRYDAFYRRAINFRNQNIFVLKNISDFKYLLSYFIFLPYHLIYKFDLAFWWGFAMFVPKIFLIRRYISVKSDREVLSNFETEFTLKNEEIF